MNCVWSYRVVIRHGYMKADTMDHTTSRSVTDRVQVEPGGMVLFWVP